MKKVILAFSFTVVASVFAVGQSGDDYKKGEGYVGYSNGQIDTGFDAGDSVDDFFRERESFNGVNISGVYNVSRYFGIKGDVSGTYNNTRFTGESFLPPGPGVPTAISFNAKSSLYNILGGVQIKDNSNSGRFKPFAHALVGAGHARSRISEVTCTPSTAGCGDIFGNGETFSETGFAGAFGGGIDIRLNNRIQIRAIQLDYNPVRLDGFTQNNVRIGAGIVF